MTLPPETPTVLTRPPAVVAAALASGTSLPLSPDVYRELCRRLAGVALAYSGAYTLAFGFDWWHARFEVPPFSIVVSVLFIAFGLLVFLLVRHGKLPPRSFANLAVGFEIVAAVGIMAPGWGWEHQEDVFQAKVWETLTASASGFPDQFVARLQAAGMRLAHMGGVPWVGVWLLAFSMMVPFSQRRTLVAAFLTAATVPAAVYASVLVHGAPPSVRPWVGDLVLDGAIPAFICAGLGVWGSRLVYKLTRDLSAERSMGSYQLEERIGGGGMGEVWRARHRLLARPAAIKFIRPELLHGSTPLSPQELVRRFEKEARATAALRSPHTVELYDFGVADDGTFYYVMELLEGLDLKRLVEMHGPMPLERAVHLLRQACLSLGDAHESGLVHRDVKPANIYACRLGIEPDFVKVVDFGLVKGRVGPIEATAELTVDGLVRGTPAFMPPEVVMGSNDVDARSDLYSLGCVAYWLVTGRHVFEGPTALATLMQHANAEPPPPSRWTGAALPDELEDTILACLRKDPAERPPSAAALDQRLARAASALPEWTRERAAVWWAEHSSTVAAVTT